MKNVLVQSKRHQLWIMGTTTQTLKNETCDWLKHLIMSHRVIFTVRRKKRSNQQLQTGSHDPQNQSWPQPQKPSEELRGGGEYLNIQM